MTKVIGRTLVVLAFSWASFANAALMTVTASGHISDAPHLAADYGAMHGQAFNLMMTFDPRSANLGEPLHGVGDAWFDSILSIELTIGDMTASLADPTNAYILTYPYNESINAADRFFFETHDAPYNYSGTQYGEIASLYLRFHHLPATPMSVDRPLNSALEYGNGWVESGWPQFFFDLNNPFGQATPTPLHVIADHDNIEAEFSNSVPIPSSLLLLATGLIFLKRKEKALMPFSKQDQLNSTSSGSFGGRFLPLKKPMKFRYF